jgi:hypothetical protein
MNAWTRRLNGLNSAAITSVETTMASCGCSSWPGDTETPGVYRLGARSVPTACGTCPAMSGFARLPTGAGLASRSSRPHVTRGPGTSGYRQQRTVFLRRPEVLGALWWHRAVGPLISGSDTWDEWAGGTISASLITLFAALGPRLATIASRHMEPFKGISLCLPGMRLGAGPASARRRRSAPALPLLRRHR